uniref:Protein LURP-one-related 15 n=1 Tax=Zea mays TaxID=4577 RepID=A0A804MLB1_MAIZE
MAAPYYGGPPAAPAPVAVVSPQFCAPYVVPLTVTKKAISLSDGDFTVTDANGATVLQVKGAVFSIRHRRVLLDAAGQPILTMLEKMGGVQRGQLERERPALHREEILDIPAEDGDGHLPGLQHRAAGVRLQDQGQLLREVVRLLPRQLQQHDRPDEPPVYRHQCAAWKGHVWRHCVPAR